MATVQTLLRGSCLCGLVAYEVPDGFEYSLYCHCSNCRRATGAAAKPFAGIKSDRLTFVSGGDHVMRYGAGANHDAHCEQCGSLLYSLVRDGAYLHVTLGTLIDSPSIRPTRIFSSLRKHPGTSYAMACPSSMSFRDTCPR